MKITKITLILLFMILILGAGLRLYDLDKESVWSDESYSILSATQDSIKEVIISVNKYEYYIPPFYYILLHYWIEDRENNEFNLRIFSAIFGIISILLVFLIAKEIFNPEIGLISSLIFSLSIIEILYSQEIRSYAFFSFLVLASTYFFVKILKDTKPFHYVLYVISSLSMIYTLPFGFIILFFQNIFIIVFYEKYRKLLKSWIFSQFLIFLLFIPEIPYFILMFKSNYIMNFGLLVDKYGAPQIFNNFLLTFIIIIILVILLTLLTVYLKKNIISFIENFQFKKYKVLFLVLLFLIAIIYFYIIPILVRPIFLTRYALFLMPFFYIFIAAGISKFKTHLKTVILLAVVLLSAYSLSIYYPETTKEDWRSAANFVGGNSKQEDLLLICFGKPAFEYYYSKDNELIDAKSYEDSSQVQSKLKDKNYWLIFSSDHKKGRVCEEIMTDPYSIKKTFKGVETYYYSK